MLVVIQEVSQEFTRDGAEYRKVTGLTGDGKQTTKNVFNNLEDKWELLKEGAALEFTMQKKGSFWNVTDVKVPEMPPPQEPIEPEPVEGEWRPQPHQADKKNKAFALSYAKDLAVADKIKYGQIISTAELFYQYLEGNVTIPEKLVIKYVADQVKAELKKGE